MFYLRYYLTDDGILLSLITNYVSPNLKIVVNSWFIIVIGENNISFIYFRLILFLEKPMLIRKYHFDYL